MTEEDLPQTDTHHIPYQTEFPNSDAC